MLTLAVYLFLFYLRAKLSKHFEKLLKKRELLIYNVVSENIRKTSFLFLVMISIFVGAKLLPLSQDIFRLIQRLTILILMLQVGLWGNVVISYFVQTWREKFTDISMAKTYAYLINLCLKTVLWIIVTLLLLENLGFEVKTMIAGVGIGGIALALAVQNILSDIMSSFSIFIDQPFVIGDHIRVDDFQGKIEHIGIKTTRMRSVDGELIIFNNSDLLKSRLRNYKIMNERRIVFHVQIPFETEPKKTETIPSLIEEIITSLPDVRLDRVHFKEIGAYSLNFEVVYYVLSREDKSYIDIQQKINYKILESFRHAGITLAYPTEKVINRATNP